MIKITEIKTTLTSLLKKTEDIDVFFTNVSKTDSDIEGNRIYKYFHVSLIPISTALFGKYLRDRALFVDVAYINDEADNNTFYNWMETMDQNFLPYVQVGKRSITIENSSFKIVDNIGHYTFTLKFRDVIDYKEQGVLAENLNINFVQED
ncbi:hypothetical protein DXD51_01195 [Eubacterium sp. TM05-53]|nr:hypothetical protein DXD51_01195 [Eubacterium sp. TM05-53]